MVWEHLFSTIQLMKRRIYFLCHPPFFIGVTILTKLGVTTLNRDGDLFTSKRRILPTFLQRYYIFPKEIVCAKCEVKVVDPRMNAFNYVDLLDGQPQYIFFAI